MNADIIERITQEVIKRIASEQGSGFTDAGVHTHASVHARAVPIGVSARHVHLSQEHIEMLFGRGYKLREKKKLMGGQYAAQECVTIVGEKLRAIENLRILGPARKQSQVEVSMTDAIRLGVNPPVRESGLLTGSAAISIVGPHGAVYLPEGCIVAMRHIHMTPGHAEIFGVRDKDIVTVRFETDRAGVFEEVLVRVDESFDLEMHIDTDEANAMGITGEVMGVVA